MKLIGLALLLLAGLLWGLGKLRELRERVERLRDLERLIQWLATEIRCHASPLPELLAQGDSAFCRAAMVQPEFSRNPQRALAQGGERLLALEKDRELLRGLAAGLGASDVQGQLEHLRLYAALAEDSLQEAREACREKGKLYVSLGVCGGAAVFLVVV